MHPEYTFEYSGAVRGKHYNRLMEEGDNVVVLEPDVAAVFRDSASVNEALRSLLEFTRSTKRLTKRSSRECKGCMEADSSSDGEQVPPNPERRM